MNQTMRRITITVAGVMGLASTGLLAIGLVLVVRDPSLAASMIALAGLCGVIPAITALATLAR